MVKRQKSQDKLNKQRLEVKSKIEEMSRAIKEIHDAVQQFKNEEVTSATQQQYRDAAANELLTMLQN